MGKLSAWETCYREIASIVNDFGGDVLFFRGQNDSGFRLEPGIARARVQISQNLEHILYHDFITRAGDLLGSSTSPWERLFAMQHAGVPTRLLDWSQTASVGLYFALKGAQGAAALWILDPFVLNQASGGHLTLPRPDELDGSYEDFFINSDKQFPAEVMALSPMRHNPRISHQRAGFTLHRELARPLEELYPQALRKVLISEEAQAEARLFLKIAGISEFALFPDLDGLAREIHFEHLGGAI
jgi:hypothetical protein